MKEFFKKNWVLLLILFLALILRLGYIFVLHAPLNWQYSETFHLASQNILAGNGYSVDGINPFVAREPGYSAFFLAPLYLIFGPSVFAGQLLQIFLSLIIILLIYFISAKYLSKKIGLLAGFILAVYPPLVAYSGELLSEIPFAFLILLSVFLLLKNSSRKLLKISLAIGIFVGAAVLTKSAATFLPIFFLPFLWLSFKNKKETLKHFLIIVFGVILVVVPYLFRNYQAFGRFIYIRDDGGLNLWAGSYLPWDGEFRGNDVFPLPEITKDLNSIESDKKLKDLAIENIKSNPLDVLKIWLKKPARLFFSPEFKSVLERQNGLADFSKKGIINPDLIKAILLAFNIFLIFFSFLGIFKLIRINNPATLLFLSVIFYFVLMVLPFSPDTRYKLVLMPYLAIFSTAGVSFLKNIYDSRIKNSHKSS